MAAISSPRAGIRVEDAGLSHQEHQSFRDPAGFVILQNHCVLRWVHPAFLPDFQHFLETPMAREATRKGELVGSVARADEPAISTPIPGGQFFEHERIPFASYPAEWPSAMLHAAGNLTLNLAEAALDEGFGLKDATPHNILFHGPRPVFVDALSFERRDPLDPTWRAYAQFVRTFLLPLAAERYCGIPTHHTLASYRDGLEPEQLYRALGLLRRWTPPLVSLVTLPKLLAASQRDESAYQPRPAASADQAQFILRGVLHSCRRQLQKLGPRAQADSTWSGYLEHKSLYSTEQIQQKERFVKKSLELAGKGPVLDMGANEGHFSFLAARAGSPVVAIDFDPAVVAALYRRASPEGLDVLPLTVDLARPTPGLGWRNRESSSFLDRARGEFDLVMMLAVLHHLLVTERIPLDQVLDLAAELSKDFLLIEFVEPEDPMFQRLLRGRGQLYQHLTRAHFEAAAETRFEQVSREQIQGLNRWLYLFRRR